jgi:hypothetical protein
MTPPASFLERWYAASHSTPFWARFDQHVPELPLVER